MNHGDLNKVWEIKALKKPGEDEARKMLEKIAKQVQPIMKKHNWRVKRLSEMCPTNPALLGLNVGGGVEVKLRLRRVNGDLNFIPYNQVLDTMLHELCHNKHGPHNASFYKLWDELRKECEELISKGVSGTGEGFDCAGKRLGGVSRQVPLSSLRKTALAAAENRARVSSLLPSGPKRLGGDRSMMTALNPIQAAAMAAERRMQDELWCGSQASPIIIEDESSTDVSQAFTASRLSGESSACSSGSSSRALDEVPSKKSRLAGNFAGRNTSNVGPKSGVVENSVPASTSSSISDHWTTTDGIEEKSFWECEICTLFNPSLAPICEACCIERPKDVATKFKIWSCKHCTLENSVKLDKCTACGQWRYSYGPPVSSQVKF
ncbi:hypothetical protein IFM89_003929 [Coptis chinensis]|uniref:Zinc ion binding protein n=1 Tax=Coptis chinensis TaxID=261450 RepID=A0A835HVR7_9MAGN|nr:hypothetical protein IFM89_003929 [Coptis chinensis]